MKLSRALLIVLLLHVVAVVGNHRVQRNQDATEFIYAQQFQRTRKTGSAGTARNASSRGRCSNRRDALARKESAPRSDAKPSHSPSKDEHAKTPSGLQGKFTL